MATNHFGTLFKITTWGESHGKAIGVVIDGCPAGLEISEHDINLELKKRSPGTNPYTSPRKEKDIAQVLSGTFDGKTTGAPISIIIYNGDFDSSKYESIKDKIRPGHANYTYLQKYGIFDHQGGGRASARETACRVAAGAIAKKLLKAFGIDMISYIKEIGSIRSSAKYSFLELQNNTRKSALFCPDIEQEKAIQKAISEAKDEGDSLGGIVEVQAINLPAGLGEPIYQKLEALLASAMLSIPASKGFEIGSGFSAASMKGSEHNDSPSLDKNGEVSFDQNHAGGTLGGISTGAPLVCRVAFKPTSSILKEQKTLSLNLKETEFKIPKGSRHDPCVAVRAVPVVEAMMALTLADLVLLGHCSRLILGSNIKTLGSTNFAV